MFPPFRRSAPLAALATILAVSPASAVTHVFVVAGQSNALGAGTTSSDTVPSGIGSVQFRYSNRNFPGNTEYASAGWTVLSAQAGGSLDNPFFHDSSAPIRGYGPELTLGRDLALGLPGDTIAIIKFAISGTQMGNASSGTGQDWWKAGGNLHLSMLSYLDSARGNLSGTPVMSGFFWMQGESDARKDDSVDRTANANAYEANLTGFITSVRSHFGTPALPFIMGRIDPPDTDGAGPGGAGPNFGQNKSIVRSAQMAVDGNVAFTGLVNTDDLGRFSGDEIHFIGAGQQVLGERMAASYFATVPEPGVAGMLLLGASGACAIRRRRQPSR